MSISHFRINLYNIVNASLNERRIEASSSAQESIYRIHDHKGRCVGFTMAKLQVL